MFLVQVMGGSGSDPYESTAFDLSESFVFVESWESNGTLEFQREMFYIPALFFDP